MGRTWQSIISSPIFYKVGKENNALKRKLIINEHLLHPYNVSVW